MSTPTKRQRRDLPPAQARMKAPSSPPPSSSGKEGCLPPRQATAAVYSCTSPAARHRRTSPPTTPSPSAWSSRAECIPSRQAAAATYSCTSPARQTQQCSERNPPKLFDPRIDNKLIHILPSNTLGLCENKTTAKSKSPVQAKIRIFENYKEERAPQKVSYWLGKLLQQEVSMKMSCCKQVCSPCPIDSSSSTCFYSKWICRLICSLPLTACPHWSMLDLTVFSSNILASSIS